MRSKRQRAAAILLAVAVIVSLFAFPALAEGETGLYYELRGLKVNGAAVTAANTGDSVADSYNVCRVSAGDVVEISFLIRRSDGGTAAYSLRDLENKIFFDADFFEVISNQSPAVVTTRPSHTDAAVHTVGGSVKIVNVSFNAQSGESISAPETELATFQLKVKASPAVAVGLVRSTTLNAHTGDDATSQDVEVTPVNLYVVLGEAPLNLATLTLDPAGGAINGSDRVTRSTVSQGSALTLPTPTRPGYAFLGW